MLTSASRIAFRQTSRIMNSSALQHEPKRILVTGGAGFIGSNFLLHMVPKYPGVQFVNLDLLTYAGNLLNLQRLEGSGNYHFVEGDIADGDLVRSLFEEHDFTTVVHFAAESHVDRSISDPLAFVRTNMVGTATLLETARHAWKNSQDVRFHHISTDEVFGSLGSEGVFTEETPYDPKSPYAASKAGSDHLVRAYGHTYGLPYTLSNTSNNYGPFQHPEKLIPLVILRCLKEESIPMYGDGMNVRDWLHVHDHCSALECILKYGRDSQTYLVSAEQESTNLNLVQTLTDLIDDITGRPQGRSRELITFVEDRPGHDFRYAIDAQHLRNELGWKPQYDLPAGLLHTVRWYIEHPEWLEAIADESYQQYFEKQYLSSGP